MLRKLQLHFLLLVSALIFGHVTECYSTAYPGWLTNLYMRAGNRDIIDSLTGAGKISTYIYQFSQDLPGTPDLAYGIGKYRGDDWLAEEFFSITEINKNETSFEVQVEIFGVTDVYLLNVAYIAIDPNFPHHVNSFDHVPLNYSNGDLVNITQKSLLGPTTYTNVINYTEQAAGRTFTSFTEPLSNIKIVLYMTTFYLEGTWWDSATNTRYPITFLTNYQILTTDTYELSVSLETNTQITKLHYSMIIYDDNDVQSSNKYYLIYQIWETSDLGGYRELPSEFFDNYMIALRDFNTVDGKCGFDYQTSFISGSPTTSYAEMVEEYGGNHDFGVEILYSRMNTGRCGLSAMRNAIFYMKTWRCDTPHLYFNSSTNLCQDSCAEYHYEANQVLEYWCEQCPHYSCLTCNSTECQSCSSSHFRTLQQGVCQCDTGYFDKGESRTDRVCGSCSATVSDCQQCTLNPSYDSSNVSSIQALCTKCDSGYFLKSDGTCQIYVACLSSNDEFIDYTDNTCKTCAPSNCITCSTLHECSVCDNDQRQGYFLNTDTKQCTFCSIGCTACNSQTDSKCTVCDSDFQLKSDGTCQCVSTHYFTNVANQCLPCHESCETCDGPLSTECKSCTTANYRQLNSISNACDCLSGYEENSPSNSSCIKVDPTACDYGYSFSTVSSSCQSTCGDGIRVSSESCDDGNQDNLDGCDERCAVENDFECTQVLLELSTCTYVGIISSDGVYVLKSAFANKVDMYCSLTPLMPFYSTIEWFDGVTVQGANITVSSASFSGSKLIISLEYYQDLQGKTLTITYSSPSNPVVAPRTNKSNSRLLLSYQIDFTFQSVEVSIDPVNNLEASLYSEQTYSKAVVAEKFTHVFSIVLVVGVFATVGLKNCIPPLAILMGIQSTFLSLSTVIALHPIMFSLFNFRRALGYNNASLFEKEDQVDPYLNPLGFTNNLLQNFNIMLFLWALVSLIGAILLLLDFLQYSNHKIVTSLSVIFRRASCILAFINLENLLFSLTVLDYHEGDFIEITVGWLCLIFSVAQISYFVYNADLYQDSLKVFLDKTVIPVSSSNSEGDNNHSQLKQSAISPTFQSSNILRESEFPHFQQSEEQSTNKNVKIIISGFILTKAAQAAVLGSLLGSKYLTISLILFGELFILAVFAWKSPFKKLVYKILMIICSGLGIFFLSVELSLQQDSVLSSKSLQETVCWAMIISVSLFSIIFLFEVAITYFYDYLVQNIEEKEGSRTHRIIPQVSSNESLNNSVTSHHKKRMLGKMDELLQKYDRKVVYPEDHYIPSRYSAKSKGQKTRDNSLDLIKIIERQKGLQSNQSNHSGNEEEYEDFNLEDLIAENEDVIRGGKANSDGGLKVLRVDEGSEGWENIDLDDLVAENDAIIEQAEQDRKQTQKQAKKQVEQEPKIKRRRRNTKSAKKQGLLNVLVNAQSSSSHSDEEK